MTNIERLYQALASADGIAVGAGAGLSTAAGYTYSGERFELHRHVYRRLLQFPGRGGEMGVLETRHGTSLRIPSELVPHCSFFRDEDPC